MAFSELIKNFDRIRDYMRDFYVFGFKSRNEYDAKSLRSYDNEKRRLESWLGDYMGFTRTPSGKSVFISIDSRKQKHNPLYRAFKTKSFTDGDITLHFILFDILSGPDTKKTLNEITDEVAGYLDGFEDPMMFDDSTVRKKLKEYTDLGLIRTEKKGRKVLYSRAEDISLEGLGDAVSFFSEAGLVGVIGSTLLDKGLDEGDLFTYKHHYITHTLESEILCTLFEAMGSKKLVHIVNISKRSGSHKEFDVLPLIIYVSVQTGRRYVVTKEPEKGTFRTLRLDYIVSVDVKDEHPDFDSAREEFSEIRKHLWGISGESGGKDRLDHVEFDLHIPPKEKHIWNRLDREKRNGTVTKTDDETAHFSCDVYDASEMLTWIRSFFCRISNLSISNKETEKRFRDDFDEMCRMYGVGGDE